MKDAEKIKEMVREKYGQIAGQSKGQNETSCCGSGCGCADYTVFSDDYSALEGYNADADLGLGCGLPTEYAGIKPGDCVIDLGSGAGNDVFVARQETGESGLVIGIDMTPEMIGKARENAAKLGFENVEFRLGDIENMPVTANKADVIISNCVLNLVPDKKRAFCEIFRVLKPGGHFSISDVVSEGILPEGLIHDAEMYAGCVAGALPKDEYLSIIRETGFEQVIIHKSKKVSLPDDLLATYLSPEEVASFKSGETGILSITVSGVKPFDPSCDV